MDNRLVTLLTRGSSLTRAEYRVLAHLTEHPMLVGNITVRELAQATFVSTATIMRLCQKLGFSGFSEFIWHCKQLLSDTPHIAAQAPSLPELPVLFNQFIANYQHTFQWVTQEKRQQFADLLRQKESFFLYGAGFSYLFAEYLTKKLQVLDKARIAKNVGMTIVAFTRASANTLAGMADVHFALYDEAVHFAAEAAGVTSFESNLVLLMDLLLLELSLIHI